MISKTRRNRISKTRRNRISKTKTISGGKKGDVHTWNLGICLIKKTEGYVNDTYWIEYPVDPLPEGWTLKDPFVFNLRIRLPIYENLTEDKELYPGIGDDKSLYWLGNYTRYPPLLEPGNQKMTKTEYIQKLRTTEWKQTKRYLYEITGLKDFIKEIILKKKNWKVKDPGHERESWANQTYTYYSQWVMESVDSTLIYNLITNFNESDVPREFKKLYTTLRDWNFETQRDSLF